MPSPYQARIVEVLARLKKSEWDPAIIEAWMRCGNGTFDALSPIEFSAAVQVAVLLAQVTDASANAALAASFGLKTWSEADAVDARKAVQ